MKDLYITQVVLHIIFAIPFIHFSMNISTNEEWGFWYALLFSVHGLIAWASLESRDWRRRFGRD